MNRIPIFSIGILAASALACAVVAVAQNQQRSQNLPAMAIERTRDSHLIGVKVVRLVNTAEEQYKSAHGAYADWNDLYRSDEFTETEVQPKFSGLHIAAGPEIVPGWNLDMVASADHRSYEFSLRNIDDKDCRFSFFSDDSGLIYQGSVVGCPNYAVIPASQ